MRTILSDLRALPGVTGVAVIGKRDGLVDHLFPAAFTERHTGRLLELATSTYQRLRGFSRLILRFERVVVYLFNQPEYLLFVTILPDVDARHLETIVNSKFAAIARVMSRPDVIRSHIAPSCAETNGTGRSAPLQTADPVEILINACNSLSDRLADSRGRVRLASEWRRARERANQGDVALTALLIDAAGRMAIRKGQTLDASAAAIGAFANMVEFFLDGLGTARTVAEEDFYTLLQPHRAILEPAGIFLYLGSSTRPRSAR